MRRACVFLAAMTLVECRPVESGRELYSAEYVEAIHRGEHFIESVRLQTELLKQANDRTERFLACHSQACREAVFYRMGKR